MPGVGSSLPYVPVFEDPRAPHQVVLRFHGSKIALTCNCFRQGYIDVRPVWTVPEVLREYEEFHGL